MKTKVEIIESESGWGQRTDEIMTFPNMEAAEKYVKKFNKCNNKSAVPDWYMYARIIGD